MDITTVQRLVAKGEGQFLEFKKKVNFPEKIVKEIVAFANTNGGKLMLGIDDDGTISGTRNIEGEIFVLEDSIKKFINPSIQYTVHTIKLNPRKGIAVFDIPEGKEKPYSIKANPNAAHGIVYVRSADESIKASKEMRQILRKRNSDRDEKFNYGEKEKVLMKMLDDSNSVTLQEFATKAQIPKFVASKTLVKLVLANLLEIKPKPDGDLFFVKS